LEHEIHRSILHQSLEDGGVKEVDAVAAHDFALDGGDELGGPVGGAPLLAVAGVDAAAVDDGVEDLDELEHSLGGE